MNDEPKQFVKIKKWQFYFQIEQFLGRTPIKNWWINFKFLNIVLSDLGGHIIFCNFVLIWRKFLK